MPKLAWFAALDRARGTVEVEHGASVETGPDYIVEGVWDGAFEEGAFHRAGNFFGSGIRLEADAVWLVPSRALVDRIMYCCVGSRVLASNSLPLLLGRTGADLVEGFNYRLPTYTSLKGVDEYDSGFPVAHPEIETFQQLYYDPLEVRRSTIKRRRDRRPVRFSDFGGYVSALRGSLLAIKDNLRSAHRRIPMGAYTTISAGYDSTAVTALVRDFGIRTAFTSRRSNSSIRPWMSRKAAIDDGTPIAEHLGLPVSYLVAEPQDVQADELYYLSATAADVELVFYRMAQELRDECKVAVVFTGFHGGKVWDANTGEAYLGRTLKRGDTSGLNLSEVRLAAGFVNVAAPFICAEEIRDIAEISRSEEMSRWRIGGDYDRPIPRRILEEAGVPRGAFGTRKKAVLQSYNYPVNRSLRREFFQWLQQRHGWPPWKVYAIEKSNVFLFLCTTAIERLLKSLGLSLSFSRRVFLGQTVDLPYELHLWAVQTLSNTYRMDAGR